MGIITQDIQCMNTVWRTRHIGIVAVVYVKADLYVISHLTCPWIPVTAEFMAVWVSLRAHCMPRSTRVACESNMIDGIAAILRICVSAHPDVVSHMIGCPICRRIPCATVIRLLYCRTMCSV